MQSVENLILFLDQNLVSKSSCQGAETEEETSRIIDTWIQPFTRWWFTQWRWSWKSDLLCELYVILFISVSSKEKEREHLRRVAFLSFFLSRFWKIIFSSCLVFLCLSFFEDQWRQQRFVSPIDVSRSENMASSKRERWCNHSLFRLECS